MNLAAGLYSQRIRGRTGAAGAHLLALSALAVCWTARADTFDSVLYDSSRDQLVVTILYRGTNPDHEFSLRWGPCSDLPDGSGKEIVGEVLDQHWRDQAHRDFRKTTRFSLADLACRPAKLTLKTAPRFYYTIHIPARLPAAPWPGILWSVNGAMATTAINVSGQLPGD